MTAIPATPDTETHTATEQQPNYLNVTKGFMSWAGTLDHKRIGIMYLIGVTLLPFWYRWRLRPACIRDPPARE